MFLASVDNILFPFKSLTSSSESASDSADGPEECSHDSSESDYSGKTGTVQLGKDWKRFFRKVMPLF